MVTLFEINTLPFRYFFWIMVVQQSQNWGTLDLTLQRLWQLSCCSALPLQCPGYHLLSWLVAEFDRCCPVSPLRVIRESVSNDWIKDSENPNIQTGRSQNCQYLQNGLSRDSTSSRQWMNFWLRQLCRRWGTTTGTCAARWCCLPSRLVSNEEKHNMAQKLLNFETPTSIKFGMLTFLEKSWRFFYCRIQILASCHCLYRNGRLMTSTEQFVKTLKCPWCCHAVTQCVCFTDIYLLIIYLAL